VSRVDAGVTLSGTRYPSPIVLNPVGSQKAFHKDGEVAVARAARARDHLMVLSTVATTSIEDAIAVRGGPVWFQLYHQSDWSLTKQVVQRSPWTCSAAAIARRWCARPDATRPTASSATSGGRRSPG
jgi:isopentenyl diphosphate isomerase/L-lactate dehydrogenase-like FMN-dependent dehydrogenase